MSITEILARSNLAFVFAGCFQCGNSGGSTEGMISRDDSTSLSPVYYFEDILWKQERLGFVSSDTRTDVSLNK